MRILSVKAVDKVGEEVGLAGWVHTRRDHGKLIFIDLRDRSGVIQAVVSPEREMCHRLAMTLRPEWVIEVVGKVKERPRGMVNKNISTGTVEIEVSKLKVLNRAKTAPFDIAGNIEQGDTKEDLRLKYRYLDLRRRQMKRNIFLRHKIVKAIRDFMDRYGFIEIETPILTKSTPEGARDFLVPSRLHGGEFYALPQSPQQFKQLLMIAGFERYFQLARCFRDEDLRGNRQPEFTQLDIEASFVSQKYILRLVEKMFIGVVRKLVTFDKNLSKKLTFNPFKRLDYQEAIKKYGTDKPDLRRNPKDPNELAFVWILNWPLFKWNEKEKRCDPHHHIFTAPRDEDLPLLDKEPLKVRSWQHDLVLNGEEIGGGSMRIHDRKIQEKIFELVGLRKEEIKRKFGHLLKAFEYGCPPHGGIASGLDRVLMILLNEGNIREVIPFPKTGDGRDLLMEAPSPVEKSQLSELHIEVTSQGQSKAGIK